MERIILLYSPGAAFIMYTAAGGGAEGGFAGGKEIFFKGENFFHIPLYHTESFDIPPLDQMKK